MKKTIRLIGVVITGLSFLAACGSSGEESLPSTTIEVEPSTTIEVVEVLCPGTIGCIPEGQPDINGDGKVKIGILSPGDTNDGGYYQGLVSMAKSVAASYGWEVIIVDMVPPAEAAEQTRNLCRLGVDLIAITDSQLADANPVGVEDICKDTIFYQNSNNPVDLTGYILVTKNSVFESQLTAGYATGLVMRELGKTAAGFVSGPDLDFVTIAYKSWSVGISTVLPKATFVKTLTGSMDDAALGQEAVKAQISQGAGIIYPYLGGASSAAVKAANSLKVLSVAAGTDRCEQPGFGVASIFSPGYFIGAVLEDLKAGRVTMGEVRQFKVGVDSVPTAKICGSVGNAAALQKELDAFIAKIGSGEILAQEFVEKG